MKRIMYLFLAALMTIMCIPATAVSAAESTDYLTCGDYQYMINESGDAVITKYTGSKITVSIPSTLDGYDVAEINGAFTENEKIECVIIPNSVKVIDNKAFMGCTSLKKAVFSKNLTEIGYFAFSKCSSLANVRFPVTLESLGEEAFSECTSITNIVITERVYSIADDAFYACTSLESVENQCPYLELGGNVFNGCEKLKSFELPGGMSEIPGGLFYGCASLTSIEIPDGVRKVGSIAFEGCTNLSEVKFPDSLIELGRRSFADCTSLTSVSLDHILRLNEGAFMGCSGLTDVKLGDGILNFVGGQKSVGVTLGRSVFRNCTGLETFDFGSNYKNDFIVAFTFKGCSSLKSVKLPARVKGFGRGAFSGCSSLGNMEIPKSVTTLGDEVFEYCTSITEISVPLGVGSLGKYIFRGCTGLKKVNLPEWTSAIGAGAFEDCIALEEFPLTGRIKRVGSGLITGTPYYNNPDNWENDALYYNDCLLYVKDTVSGEYTIKDGTRLIADKVFAGCYKITEVNFPYSVTCVGESILGAHFDIIPKWEFNGTRRSWRYRVAITTPNDVLLKNVQFTGVPGDIDGDGVVSPADCLLLRKYLADVIEFTIEERRAADCNRDGRVNALDCLEMYRKLIASVG